MCFGFGVTTQGGNLSPELLETEIVSVDMQTCELQYGQWIKPDHMICAAAPGTWAALVKNLTGRTTDPVGVNKQTEMEAAIHVKVTVVVHCSQWIMYWWGSSHLGKVARDRISQVCMVVSATFKNG